MYVKYQFIEKTNVHICTCAQTIYNEFLHILQYYSMKIQLHEMMYFA